MKADKKSNAGHELRILGIVLIDIIIINLSAFLAIMLRMDFSIEDVAIHGFLRTLRMGAIPGTISALLMFKIFGLYSSAWEYAGERELISMGFASVCASALYYLAVKLMGCLFPRSFPFIYTVVLFLIIAVSRVAYRQARRNIISRNAEKGGKLRRTMLIGAGDGAVLVIRDLENNPHAKNRVMCLIDDDPAKRGTRVRGIKVVGGRDKIIEAARRYDIEDIIFCIPSASDRLRNEILEICSRTGAQLKTLPSLDKLISGELTLTQIKNVSIEDLLGRTQVHTDNAAIRDKIQGKTVLVTGGGGSIGSELCRQVAALSPSRLIIFDIYENNAYDIQMELKRRYPGLDLVTLIGSVRDERRVRYVFDTYRPDVVCHAAAHKHVPLMEDSPAEAIKNNIFGTYNVAKAAGDYGTGLFILISTDKAVNPTNVMGASKRMCEMVVQSMNGQHHTKYIAVRFGNVLGSNGSVIPLFRKQIAEGGPVTVTDKRVTRFFMTIPEAVSLILQAGAYAEGGEVFVLDMGEPVRIDDMARKMIRLSGFEPDVDIQIKYIGLRPGEKLYEELLLKSEGLQKTDNKLIYIGHQVMYTPMEIEEKLETLRQVLYASNPRVRECMLSIIKEPADSMYEPIPGAVNPADTIEV